VVVEAVDAAVAGAAVFAGSQTVAVAELAEEDAFVIWGEYYLAVVAGPFVVVDHAVGGVGEAGEGAGEEEEQAGDRVEGEEGGGWAQGEDAGEVGCD
jgi:hypothetical protein